MMNESTNLTSELGPLTAREVMFLYACGPVAVIGFLLCSLSTLVFSSSHFKLNNQNLFTYLQIECGFMSVNLFIKILFTFTNYNRWTHITRTLFAKIVYTYINGYISSIIETCVTVSNILSTICCLSLFDNTTTSVTKVVAKQNPFVVMSGAFGLASLMFLYIIFYTESGVDDKPVSLTIEFFKANHNLIDSIAFTIRDVVLLFVLISLNCLLVYRIHRLISKKKEIVSKQSSAKTRDTLKKTTIMVLIDCLNTIIGRSSILIYFYVINYAPGFITNTMPYLSSLAFFNVYLSYTLKFFHFLFFNKRFREICSLKSSNMYAGGTSTTMP